jgi:thiosulfate/3-mercaptopyruvate sulfurtransferase
VLDVRDAESFARGHIAGARNASNATLSEVIDKTPKSASILIYCYHGNASREYAQIFSDFGFAQVHSLDGGYEAWRTRRSAESTVTEEALQRWLKERGFSPHDINAVIDNGTTPLMKASHKGEGSVGRMLIEAGAQLDARNADGNNALWLACVGGHLDIIDMLIDAGIDIDNRNDNGATPLMYAASSGKADVIGRLLAHGADIGPETLDGFTALDLAATVECLTLLRRATEARNMAEATGALPPMTSLRP